jgi:hypothetical protein
MEIVSSMPSKKAKLITKDQKGDLVTFNRAKEFMKPVNHSVYSVIVNSIRWDDEITIDEADSLLEKAFYPFKEVNDFIKILIL